MVQHFRRDLGQPDQSPEENEAEGQQIHTLVSVFSALCKDHIQFRRQNPAAFSASQRGRVYGLNSLNDDFNLVLQWLFPRIYIAAYDASFQLPSPKGKGAWLPLRE